MDFSQVDIAQLVQETFQVNRVKLADCHSEVQDGLTGPGLIYSLQGGANTFSIRGLATGSIKQTLKNIHDDSSLQRILKISEYYPVEDLLYYPTPEKLEADVIIDHLGNRRFPYQEDSLCNLSDPGFSWWMQHDNNSISIYFKSFGIERVSNLVQLGPIADTALAISHLQEISKYLENLFPVAEVFCSPKQFTVATKDYSAECFNCLKKLFLDGEWGSSAPYLRFNSLPKTPLLFLSEVAAIRRFWIHLEQQIRRKSNLSSCPTNNIQR
ncbi:MAG: hypothetical protein HN353_13470 [Bdellovibrionales bacterium]|jgi:hypothetical protein|nr:hypothetical protein [Bdellovibrionales bacterium]MBT3524898.1 hypothetical protein [Bdellovibrionales bacterium]MBT7669035.1 hypothetical protein [Bdellovibrionales bacterium]MBT7766806.1 hypothetical protein [Bdellovibrionales bacterium]